MLVFVFVHCYVLFLFLCALLRVYEDFRFAFVWKLYPCLCGVCVEFCIDLCRFFLFVSKEKTAETSTQGEGKNRAQGVRDVHG